MILDTLINQKLDKYYKGNDISKSLKSMIHVKLTYEIQLPDKVWTLIKQFIIWDKEYYKLVKETDNAYIIKNGKFFTIPSVFNKFTAIGNARNSHIELRELRKLDLDRNPQYYITDSLKNPITDIMALGNALSTNSTLTELYLGWNQIRDITALGNALKTNSTLTTLWLWRNQITDITALANALNTNSTLRDLNLSRNKIKDITALANALNTNSTLNTLYLKSNRITDNDKSLIRRAWGKRSGMRSISLDL